MMKLLLGGSPCTSWSIARKGRETQPEGIGWELFDNYLIARDKFRPEYFLYENNKSMAPAIRAQITRELGVEPILINSALVSAQNRQRLYWTNIPGVEQPEDRGVVLLDVLESGPPLREKWYTLDANYYKGGAAPLKHQSGKRPIVAEPVNVTADGKAQCLRATYYKDGIRNMVGNTIDRKTCVAEPVRIVTIKSGTQTEHDSKPFRVYSPDGKDVTMRDEAGGYGAKTGLYAVPVSMSEFVGRGHCYPITFDADGQMTVEIDGRRPVIYEAVDGQITIKGQQFPTNLANGFYIIRKLTVRECKRLQTVPEEYIFPVSDTQAYKMLGNGWTVDVIAHILHYAPGITEEPLEVLSMYDGMSCGHLALDKLGAHIAHYYTTEIDKYAIQTTQHNFPDTIQLGDAFQVRRHDWRDLW